MAKKKKADEKKIVLERMYNVPLRKEFLKVPKYKRAKKAITALKAFLVRHMKSDKIKIGRFANLKIWERGIRNPVHHIKVIAKKDEEGNVFAELEGAPVEKPVEKAPAKKSTAKGADAPKDTEKPETATEKLAEKVESVKKEKAETAKKIEKEEISELKKEHPKQHAPKVEVKAKEVTPKPTAPAGKGEMSKP